MGSVNTRAVVEHGLAVRRRDGQGRAEGEQNTEPHLELAWAKLMPVCLSSTSRPILRGCRACARSTLTHMCPPDSLSARLNANAAAEKGCGEREGASPPTSLSSRLREQRPDALAWAFERVADRSEKLRLRRTHTGRQEFELFKDGRGKKVAGNRRQTRALVAPDFTIQN